MPRAPRHAQDAHALQADESMMTSLHSIGLDATNHAGAGGNGAAGQGEKGAGGRGQGQGFQLRFPRPRDGAIRRDAEFELGCEGAVTGCGGAATGGGGAATGGGGATGSTIASSW